jgi:hypothetical protein
LRADIEAGPEEKQQKKKTEKQGRQPQPQPFMQTTATAPSFYPPAPSLLCLCICCTAERRDGLHAAEATVQRREQQWGGRGGSRSSGRGSRSDCSRGKVITEHGRIAPPVPMSWALWLHRGAK